MEQVLKFDIIQCRGFRTQASPRLKRIHVLSLSSDVQTIQSKQQPVGDTALLACKTNTNIESRPGTGSSPQRSTHSPGSEKVKAHTPEGMTDKPSSLPQR